MRLAARYGGSSGEHGDGRARSELLPMMYTSGRLALIAEVKHALDPRDLLNPGVLVAPAPFDAEIRLAGVPPRPSARRCSTTRSTAAPASGNASPTTPAAGGVMCPSYQATREEQDTTRGRARVLQDVVTGRLRRQARPWVTHSICAWPAKDARETARRASTWRRTRPRRCTRSTPEAPSATHYTLGRLPQLLAKVPPSAGQPGLAPEPALAGRCSGVDRAVAAGARAPPVQPARPDARRGPGRGALGGHVHQPVHPRGG